MRLTLSAADSQRWASSPEDAWQVEEAVLTWATDAGIEEPIVVVTTEGKALFGFTVDRGEP